ncbi:polyprenyl synthetase family protein [Nonomuraea cavernae]|uniref:polyprenyl synthetase family protein n=1 Tax=Nonomuraea cavernae TaxID=2045107 RepID=UPI0033D733B0
MTTVTSRADTVRELIDDRLEKFLDQQGDGLAFLGQDAGPLRDFLTGFVRDGGKRLRPSFVYWGHRAAGGTDDRLDAVLAAGCAIEIMHAAALLLDDVMDQADARRGGVSAHLALAELHRESRWRGDPGRFGESAAILLGLLAFTWADAALLDTGDELGPALEVFTLLRQEAIGGQYLDLAWTARGAVGVRQAAHISVYKTAKYTIERPLHLGHAIARGTPEIRRRLSAYAIPLGEAFQLRDDVLGVFGDPAGTGKPAGDDLRQGKATYLLAQARARAGRDAALLDHPRDEDDLTAARELIVSCGALAAVEERIAELVGESTAALAVARELPADAVVALVDLAGLATERTF